MQQASWTILYTHHHGAVIVHVRVCVYDKKRRSAESALIRCNLPSAS